jgi:hypothetical protein
MKIILIKIEKKMLLFKLHKLVCPNRQHKKTQVRIANLEYFVIVSEESNIQASFEEKYYQGN